MIDKIKMPTKAKELADKLERKGLEKQVCFNVLTRDKLSFRWKDNVNSTYYAVISNPDKPNFHYEERLGKNIWGIQLMAMSPDPASGTDIDKIRNRLSRIRDEVDAAGLEVVQEYVPEFLR